MIAATVALGFHRIVMVELSAGLTADEYLTQIKSIAFFVHASKKLR
jgi:hypothetical protein